MAGASAANSSKKSGSRLKQLRIVSRSAKGFISSRKATPTEVSRNEQANKATVAKLKQSIRNTKNARARSSKQG